ncbi:hypothetical protein TIFTF001_032639 [Ficus carica]|uniref:Uncharacterized protein n=1 Tax=Ficus carica TaxID=3494 RepID=A0AA88J6Y8_FICCA|nr:hypothetical protein TIFTF001_032639 [Ficus carica]
MQSSLPRLYTRCNQLGRCVAMEVEYLVKMVELAWWLISHGFHHLVVVALLNPTTNATKSESHNQAFAKHAITSLLSSPALPPPPTEN